MKGNPLTKMLDYFFGRCMVVGGASQIEVDVPILVGKAVHPFAQLKSCFHIRPIQSGLLEQLDERICVELLDRDKQIGNLAQITAWFSQQRVRVFLQFSGYPVPFRLQYVGTQNVNREVSRILCNRLAIESIELGRGVPRPRARPSSGLVANRGIDEAKAIEADASSSRARPSLPTKRA
ncbi:hypothetical protein CK219_26895 [Mesorhizobium sp. WSM4313]|nr:hypothetical protein CK219_26895 [Mesorhizobium sp. WSM4313]